MSRIVIAGGGVAGLEALVALRAHLRPKHEIELLEVAVDLVERQHSVVEAFGGPAPRRYDVARIAAEHHASLRPDRLSVVHADVKRIRTVRGDVLDYDALLVAVGARKDVAIPGALTFWGPRAVPALARMLDDVRSRRARRVIFAVPSDVAWTLPLYELALMTADHLQTMGLPEAQLSLVTPERRPLDAFGAPVAARVSALLHRRGIAVVPDTAPVRLGAHGLELDTGGALAADWVVTLPRLTGPWIARLPHDADGFIPVDEHGAVKGVPGVWAAGDATTFPIKQGGIAAQQADAAALAIAARSGKHVQATPFRPVLRGMLLDPMAAQYFDGEHHEFSTAPLWWPPSKVASRHLGTYLAGRAGDGAAADEEVDVGALLLKLAGRHAAAGDRALALRCFDAARQVIGALPPDAASARDWLRAPSPSPARSEPSI